MDNEGSNETGNDAVPEPIETSVVALDAGMIIVQASDVPQPMDVIQPDNDSNSNSNDQPVVISSGTVESSNDVDVTPSRRKRKRSLLQKSISPKKAPPPLDNDEDDGSTCSICLDGWESKGEHRLVSLKCGHLFGDSCIKRWIAECSAQMKCCPTCKSRAAIRDLRPLYAKRVVVFDKSEEYRLQDLLDLEKTKNVELQSTLSAIKLEMAVCKEEYSKLEFEYAKLKKYGGFLETQNAQSSSHRDIVYRMSLHKNIDINREGGCRTLTYGRRIQTLILSQKSTMRLFPGYGVRFVSAYNMQPTVYFRVAPKSIRDLSLDSDEELLTAVAQDVNAYIYSVTNNTAVATITPSESPLWATSFDKIRPRYLHVGSQQGITYIYDVRNCMTYVEQLTTPGDFSPVVAIQSIPVSNDFRFGGFVVCKLQSLWFYEYTGSERIEQTKLTIEGPFVSINFDEKTNILLVTTRTSSKYPQARLIAASLTKIDQTTVLRTICTILGSRTQPVMTRSTQLAIDNDSIVASYLQDTKVLGAWNATNGNRMHAFNIDDCILDMCPMYLSNGSLLATLSESKCRIFQLNKV